MRDKAIELGFKEIMLAKNPTQNAIMDALRVSLK
jgi:hypothetical protein